MFTRAESPLTQAVNYKTPAPLSPTHTHLHLTQLLTHSANTTHTHTEQSGGEDAEDAAPTFAAASCSMSLSSGASVGI